MSRCAKPHPDLPITCVAPERFPNHDSHFAMHEGESVEWHNPSYVEPIRGQKSDPSMRNYVRARVTEVANEVRRADDLPDEEPESSTTLINVE